MANVGIKAYLEERLKELEEKTIAKQEEVMKILTKHVRRESVEHNVTKDGEIVNTPTSVANSIKAAELLGKRYGMWTEKVDTNINIPTIISGGEKLED